VLASGGRRDRRVQEFQVLDEKKKGEQG
jgi:hypothetical protein